MNIRMDQTLRIVLVFLLLAISTAEATTELTTSATVRRLVFVGDSITCGVGVKNRNAERYSAVATRLLQKKYAGIQEINLGKSGNALCQQPENYAESILAQKPDAVVIQWGVNDQYWGFSVAQFAARYEQLVHALRSARSQMPIVLTTLVADFRWPENQDAWIGEANVAIQEIGAREHCPIADLHRTLDHNQALYADSIHPNSAGAAAMAKTIAATFDEPANTASNLYVSFDQGAEVRFMQYVFFPRRSVATPQWIRVMNLTPTGMRIETPALLAIRTAPIYVRGAAYRIVVRNEAGEIMESTK